MKKDSFLSQLVAHGQRAQDGYFQYAHIVACELPNHLHESLMQLVVQGPVYDGNVVSKSYRDELLSLGLATRVCCKGEQGYTGATYFAFSVHKIIKQLKSGEIGA